MGRSPSSFSSRRDRNRVSRWYRPSAAVLPAGTSPFSSDTKKVRPCLRTCVCRISVAMTSAPATFLILGGPGPDPPPNGPVEVWLSDVSRYRSPSMGRVTVFGAGAMGTALAMHAARRGLDVALWANAYDERALEAIRAEGKHPALPEHVPSTLSVHGPEDLHRAAEGCEFAIMGASSAGARALAGRVGGGG